MKWDANGAGLALICILMSVRASPVLGQAATLKTAVSFSSRFIIKGQRIQCRHTIYFLSLLQIRDGAQVVDRDAEPITVLQWSSISGSKKSDSLLRLRCKVSLCRISAKAYM